MKNVFLGLAALLLLPGAAFASAIDVSEGGTYVVGDSIESTPINIGGGNTMTITSGGDTVILNEGSLPSVWGAPNGGGSVENGGASYPYAFADQNKVHDYKFSFATAVPGLSLLLLDYGDFNPVRATKHEVMFTAFDAGNNVVDTAVLSFTSDNSVNPNTGSAGNLYITGDAVTAVAGEPGNFIFTVGGGNISYATLTYWHNGSGSQTAPSDPNIGIGSIAIVPEPATMSLLGLGVGGLVLSRIRRKRS